MIDFPNSLDEAWTIDIKKSRARPPHAVRERLRQIINRITARSVTVHRGAGRSFFRRARPVLGALRRSRRHPFRNQRAAPAHRIPGHKTLARGCGSASCPAGFDCRLSLPVEMIYSDYSTHPREINQSGG